MNATVTDLEQASMLFYEREDLSAGETAAVTAISNPSTAQRLQLTASPAKNSEIQENSAAVAEFHPAYYTAENPSLLPPSQSPLQEPPIVGAGARIVAGAADAPLPAPVSPRATAAAEAVGVPCAGPPPPDTAGGDDADTNGAAGDDAAVTAGGDAGDAARDDDVAAAGDAAADTNGGAAADAAGGAGTDTAGDDAADAAGGDAAGISAHPQIIIPQLLVKANLLSPPPAPPPPLLRGLAFTPFLSFSAPFLPSTSSPAPGPLLPCFL